MAFSFTQNTIDKLELLLKTQGYKVRYEKGNFRTAACILESSKIVVVNKFSSIESKITSLIDLIHTIEVDDSELSDKQKQFLQQLNQTYLQL